MNDRKYRRKYYLTAARGKAIVALLILASVTVAVSAQQKLIDRAGKASFFSSAPLEDIKANSEQVVSILDTKSGEIAASMLMRSFNFRKALMEEHFNENFVESHKYPKAVFKGKIQNINALDLAKDGTYTLEVNGEITLHGVTRPVTMRAEAVVEKGNVMAKAVFPLTVKDFKIDVPTLVIDNIAEVVEVTVSFYYKPM